MKNTKPDRQTLTLFKEGVYYDFPMDDDKQSITMMDPLGGRIVMLSAARQVKTNFATDSLSAHIAKVASEVEKNSSSKELAKIVSASKQVAFDSERNVVRIGDDSLTYEATLQTPRDASMVQQFADFADLSAKLNAIMPRPFPPFARLELNRQIASRNALPDTIQRTTKHNGHTFVVKTKLLVIASLSSDDEAKIRLVGDPAANLQRGFASRLLQSSDGSGPAAPAFDARWLPWSSLGPSSRTCKAVVCRSP